jgi:hypothetical protein
VSAIGRYAVLNRSKFDACVNAARDVRSQTSGMWIFKRTEVIGVGEFKKLWDASVSKTVDFDYSGYVLGQYLDAQSVINERVLFDEESELGRTLAKVFTAAFVFDKSIVLPALPASALDAYCREEAEDDGPAMVEAMTAAHAFYAQGLKEIDSETVVVFVIS